MKLLGVLITMALALGLAAAQGSLECREWEIPVTELGSSDVSCITKPYFKCKSDKCCKDQCKDFKYPSACQDMTCDKLANGSGVCNDFEPCKEEADCKFISTKDKEAELACHEPFQLRPGPPGEKRCYWTGEVILTKIWIDDFGHTSDKQH